MRYELVPLDDAPAGREVTIGWDGPLSSYYLQVLDEPSADSDEEIIETVWEGAVPHEHPEPDRLLALAAEYARVPASLAESLRADKQAAGSQFAGRVGTHFVGEENLASITDPDQAARILVDLDGQTRF